MQPEYSALIRTYNSVQTLPRTLASLANQTAAPSEYVFVDSGSADGTLDMLPPRSKVHRFAGARFNYAEALNQGLERVSRGYVLIVSSHTTLSNPTAIQAALRLLESDETIGAAYFTSEGSGALAYERIDRSSFNGFNGLWNTCALIKVPLLRKRGFRPEVFSAEDQEWAKWLLESEGKWVARYSGAGMSISNPRRYSRKKKLNEYIAIAYYTNRKLLGFSNLIRVLGNVVGFRRRLGERLFNAILFFYLCVCRFRKPQAESRYF